MDANDQNTSELKQVAVFLGKHKRSLLLVTIICAVLSAGISLFIPKEYKSVAVVFPPGNLSLEVNGENPNFGYDIEADRLLQILQSTEIRDSVIKRFDLIKYYDIDTSEKDWLTKLTIKYQNDIEFKRTTFMSIIISCQTKDPELSAGIVNHILLITDKVREKLYKKNVKIAYAKLSDEFAGEKRITDSLFNVLSSEMKDMNISGLVLLAPNAQLNLSMDLLSKVKGTSDANANIGADILKYRYHLDRRNEFEVKSKRVKKNLEYPIAQIHVLDAAEPNYKKVFPLVSLNVLISALLGFILTSMYYIVNPKNT